jgi:hypothetical protein
VTACNATLTTATVDHSCQSPTTSAPTEGVFCDGVQHVTLHTMTCKRSRACTDGQHRCWSDDWDGATPHIEPVPWVTDAEVAEAHALLPGQMPWEVRIALEAAAKVRQATEGNKT